METLSSKVPEATLDRIEEYADTHDLNRSQAARKLIETGLDAEQSPDRLTLPTVLAGVGLFLYLGANADITINATAGSFGAVLVVLAMLIQYKTLVDWLLGTYRDLKPA